MGKKDNQPMVSVIVPVYRAEKYINQCVDSLLGQTYHNIEVILVDDGSPDRSGAICDEYAARDSRVKVIHQPNGGVSVARQTGIDSVTGEYSIHVDPDDWVEPTMIEELVAKAIETGAEYVICDHFEEYSSGTIRRCNNPGKVTSTRGLLEKSLTHKFSVVLWNVLLKRDAIIEIAFTQPNLLRGEDQLYMIRVMRRNLKIAYVASPFYHYRCENAGSLNHNFTDSHVQACYDFALATYDEVKDDCAISENALLDFKIISLKYLIKSGSRKWFKKAKGLFPDAHGQAIKEGRCYRWYSPLSSCLSIALRGYPTIACMVYNLNMWVIWLKEKVRDDIG